MSYEFIKVVREGRLTIVEMNRPEVYNALHPAASAEMAAAFDDFESDPEQWVCILTGAGEKAFCAGNDLKYQSQLGPEKFLEEFRAVPCGFGGITSRFTCDKPLIAAVNGIAMGGGFELALACDLIVAAESAVFALPEPRVGLMADAGGVYRLPRQIPLKFAMGILLTGRRVPAAEAQTLGIVNEVAPLDGLMDAARKWADLILECGPLSIRATKQSVYSGLSMPLENALEMTFPAAKTMYGSEDFIEGAKAFAEKRKPAWLGR